MLDAVVDAVVDAVEDAVVDVVIDAVVDAVVDAVEEFTSTAESTEEEEGFTTIVVTGGNALDMDSSITSAVSEFIIAKNTTSNAKTSTDKSHKILFRLQTITCEMNECVMERHKNAKKQDEASNGNAKMQISRMDDLKE